MVEKVVNFIYNEIKTFTMSKNPYIILTEKRAKELVKDGEASFGLEKTVLNFQGNLFIKVGKEYKTKHFLGNNLKLNRNSNTENYQNFHGETY